MFNDNRLVLILISRVEANMKFVILRFNSHNSGIYGRYADLQSVTFVPIERRHVVHDIVFLKEDGAK